jgi:hypothetical protein
MTELSEREKKKIALIYSQREEGILKEIFGLLAQNSE